MSLSEAQAFTKYIENFQNLPEIKNIRGYFVALYVYLFGLMPVHMTTAKCTFYAINIDSIKGKGKICLKIFVNGCR